MWFRSEGSMGFRPEGSMSTRRVDADQETDRCGSDWKGRCGSDRKGRCGSDWKGQCGSDRKGRCRPEGWSMPTERVDAMPTKVGRCRPARSMLRRIPTRPEKPERQTVETPEEAGISENTGTKNSRRSDLSGKHRNTEAPSGRHQKHRRAVTSDPFGNTGSWTRVEDIREPRHSEERESEANAKSEIGTDVRDGKPEPSCEGRK
jgi:hypothetical protein